MMNISYRRLPWLILLLTLGTVSACPLRAQGRSVLHLTGSINHRLAIEMTLTHEGQQLFGFYFYERIGRAVRLTGSVDKVGHVRLEEIALDNKVTGAFTGTLVAGKHLSGTWKGAKGGRALPFALEVEAKPPTKQVVAGSALLEEKTLRIPRTQSAENSRTPQILLRYPIVRGHVDEGTLQKLNRALSPHAVYDETPVDKLSEDGWLNEIAYEVSYNKHSLLDLTFIIDGAGAYPDTLKRSVLLNLKTGDPIRATDVFAPEALQPLVELIDKNLQEELREARRAYAQDSVIIDRLAGLHFKPADLNHFSIGERGLTFRVEYGFPHVIKAAEPLGLFFYPYATLKPYLRKNGPLAAFYMTVSDNP